MHRWQTQNTRTDSLPLTFSDLAGVALLSAEGHADIHVVGGGIWQVLCTAVHGPAAHWLRRLAPWEGALLCPELRRSVRLTAGTTDTQFFPNKGQHFIRSTARLLGYWVVSTENQSLWTSLPFNSFICKCFKMGISYIIKNEPLIQYFMKNIHYVSFYLLGK